MSFQTILDADVRPDLAAAHAETFADFGRPGDWLRADERTAVVRVVRAARDQPDQPPWYRPSTEHDDFDPLPAAGVDAAWRLTNHPGTLTADWYADTVAQLPSPQYYVELAGIVAVANALDRLASILAYDPVPIPEPEPGDPAQPNIPAAVDRHWVPTALDARGPNVLRASSVAPMAAAMRTRVGNAHYMSPREMADLDFSRGSLDRRQIELIAGATSMENECFY